MKLSMMEGETTMNETKTEPRLKGRGPRLKGRQLYVFKRLKEMWPASTCGNLQYHSNSLR